MKHILVTGSGSYIGTSLAEWLKLRPDEYTVDFVDLKNESWMDIPFFGFDSVVHTAGIVHIKENKKNAPLYYSVNCDQAYLTAVKAKREGVKQFIYISTMSVYGIESGVISGDTVPAPKSNYGKSKLEAEELISSLAELTFTIALIRAPMVYGKGCKGNYTKLEKLVLNIPVFPDIKNQRSMIYIYNLCEFIRLLIDRYDGGLFFPQNDEYVCTSEMAKMIATKHGIKLRTTRFFNPVIMLIKKGAINKMFGTLLYEKKISLYDEKYCLFNLEESIAGNGGK